MIRQAQGGHLKDLPGIPNLNAYVVAWAVSWHFGDFQHCLSRLEAVYQSLHPTARETDTPAPARDVSRTEGRELADFEPNPPKRQHAVYDTRAARSVGIPDSLEPSVCECGAEIFFVPTPSGATMPVTSDGVSHFETCPDAATFSGRSKKQAQLLPEPRKPPPPGKFPSKANPVKPKKPRKQAAPPPKAEGSQQRLMF